MNIFAVCSRLMKFQLSFFILPLASYMLLYRSTELEKLLPSSERENLKRDHIDLWRIFFLTFLIFLVIAQAWISCFVCAFIFFRLYLLFSNLSHLQPKWKWRHTEVKVWSIQHFSLPQKIFLRFIYMRVYRKYFRISNV